ncbi:O-methyltransferase [Spirosoma arcticum]
MYSDAVDSLPKGFADIQIVSQAIGFSMPSDLQTGALLRTLIGSKPSAKVLEIGTGTGLATAWLLAGMDADSSLISIDNETEYQSVADRILGDDARLQLICTDAGHWLDENKDQQFDLIFADAWPGKYANLDAALNSLLAGGIYIIDDMLPQPNWPAGHGDNVNKLVADLESRKELQIVKMAWSTGILIATKK